MIYSAKIHIQSIAQGLHGLTLRLVLGALLLTLRAISAIGTRVAFWYGPDCGRTPEQIADTFAAFAASIVGLPPRSG